MGVGFFFLLSGFILSYTYYYRGSRVDIGKFWGARFARVYPIYVVGLLIAAPLVLLSLFQRLEPADAIGTAAIGGVLATSLLQAWHPVFATLWNGPGWSLSVEAFFYAIFPLVVPVMGWLNGRKLLWLAIGLYFLGLIVPMTVSFVPPSGFESVYAVDSPEGLWASVFKFNPLFHLHTFLIGAILGVIHTRSAGSDRLDTLRTWPSWWSPFAIVLLFAACGFASQFTPYLLFHNGILTVLNAGLILGLCTTRGGVLRLLDHRFMVALGEASYAIYIVHKPVANWFEVVDNRLFHWREDQPLLLFGIYLCVVLVLSRGLYSYIEEPARRSIRNWISSRRRLRVPEVETSRA